MGRSLITLLKKSPSPDARADAAAAIGKRIREESPLDGVQLARALASAIRKDVSPVVRAAAATAARDEFWKRFPPELRELTLKPLIAALQKDPEPEVRAAAATSLGEFTWIHSFWDVHWREGSSRKETRPIEPLAAALGDAHTDVRAAAAGALGRYGDPRAEAPLIASLDIEARGDLVWKLAICGGVDALTCLISLFDHGDESIRCEAIRCVVAYVERVAGLYPKGIQDGHGRYAHLEGVWYRDPELSISEVRALATTRFVELLDDEDSWTRMAAADALAALGETGVASRLIDRVDEGTAEVPELSSAVTALALFGGPLVIETLHRVLDRGRGGQGYLTTVARALARMKDPRGIQCVRETLARRWSDTRFLTSTSVALAAASALSDFGDENAIAYLEAWDEEFPD